MISERQIDLFSTVLARRYTEVYGASVSKLKEWTFSTELLIEEDELFEEFNSIGTELEFHERILLIFDELEERGIIEEMGSTTYRLTPSGLSRGKAGKTTKVIDYLNKNPGINTGIALLALLVSLIALYVSFTKQ